MKRFFYIFATVSYFFIIFSPFAYAEAPLRDNLTVTSLQSIGIIDVLSTNEERFTVVHEEKEGDLFIECFVNDFLFSKEKEGTQHVEGEGHLRLYVNQEHIDTLYKGAFIVKGLPKGQHDVQVMLVKNDRTPYELEETFQVTIGDDDEKEGNMLY